ncbi:MAG: histidine kinase [Alphaproteobacteria bacterium]|nr:MAG: histidine kinase [Alphaproteobacteria bacterium]
MPDRRLPPRRLLFAVAVVAAPTALVLLILVFAGLLSPLPALLALIAAAGLLAVPIRQHLAHLAALAGYLRGLGAERGATTAGPPAPHGPGPSALAPDLSEAAAESGRAWTARRRELEGVVSAKETILTSLPDPLILLDAARRVVRANPAADALFGEPISGRDLFAMLRNPALVEAVDAVLAGGPGRVVEFSLTVPMERSLSARVERLPQRLADGTVCLISLHDLTQIKKADQMRADFVANASHELRTPLSTLTGFIETLMGPAKDDAEAQERFLAIMHEQAARMGRLVADLLSLSRIELNEHSAPSGEVKLDRVIGSVADILQLKARDKSMRIELGALPPGVPAEAGGSLAGLPEVTGDPDELAQVFQNLIDNAIKYGRPGSAIRISGWLALETPGPAPARPAEHPVRMTGRRPPVAVAVAIADEGDGIPREHLPRLTERFYRIDSARSRDLGGTGLGLAIVKHILSRHRGGLRIESSPGVGSVFTVFLPVSPAARERLRAEGAVPESLPAGQAASRRHGS